MHRSRLFLIPSLLITALCATPSARASDALPPPPTGLRELGAMPVQDGGRIMPLESYAARLAVQLTGRTRWSREGPEAFTRRSAMQLWCDLTFRGQEFLNKELIAIENRPFKRLVGLDDQRRFFTPVEVANCKGMNALLTSFTDARSADPQVQPTPDQRRALEIRDAVQRVAAFADGQPMALVPQGAGRAFLRVGIGAGDPGTEPARTALASIGEAYRAGRPVNAEVARLSEAIASLGSLSPREARAVRLELFYDRHQPWLWTDFLYGGSIVLFGLSRLVLRRPLVIAAVVAAAAGVAEHLLGIGLRVAILGRAPVSNTYEALLWMGLVAIAIGLVAQLVNRRGWYLFAGLCAALLSVLFAGLVPLEDRTNSLPAVLRSNFWLITHVLTIVASYGILAVASVLGHAYLAREVLFARRDRVASTEPRRSAPLIVQTYRTIQVGLLLLTAGTLLGGVWAAESWGRFWGWDPKETWALISILVYFAVLHARYVRWLMDFGMAAAAIIGFVVIVWTFYGVNYVMATGLHSYGFGSGGEFWVGLWAVAEVAFLVACRVRYAAARRVPAGPHELGGGAPARV